MNQLRPSDFEAVSALLLANDLLVSDLSDADMASFVGCRSEGTLVAVGGVQTCGNAGLLRSIATSSQHRGKGCGVQLVDTLEQRASSNRISSIYLLTETAADFFSRLGYTAIERAEVPEAIRSTQQFSALCPDSATCMMKSLPNSSSGSDATDP